MVPSLVALFPRALFPRAPALGPALAAAFALGACGAPPAPQTAPAPSAAPAAPPASASAAASSGAPNAEAAACLELSVAKRVKRIPEPEKVTVKHVLVRFAGSSRGDAAVTRTKGQACLRALEVRDKVRGGADFDEMVKTYSEEPGAASRGGSLGAITRAGLAPPFADAAFELEVNQLSDVVQTEFGFHVLLRTP